MDDFTRLYESPTEPTQNSKCLNIGRKSNICIEISTYYDYLEYLLNKREYILLDDEYVNATAKMFIPSGITKEDEIQEIKNSSYLPTKEKNKAFFDWAEQQQTQLTTSPISSKSEDYKKELMTLNVINDKGIIDMYFNNLLQWNAQYGNFERIKRGQTTQEKLDLLIKLKDRFQYDETIKTQDYGNITKTRNDNEVELCLTVSEQTYIY